MDVGKSSYYFIRRFLELITIIVFAAIFDVSSFGTGMFIVLLIYFLMSIIKFPIQESKNIKKLFNTLTIVYPVYGLITGLVFIVVSFALPQLISRLALIIGLAVFYGIKSIPEYYFLCRDEIKVHKVYAYSQLLLLVIVFFLKSIGFSAILLGYLGSYILITILLWKDIPYKFEPKFGGIKDYLVYNFDYMNGLFLVLGLVSLKYFSFMYLAYFIGYFFYTNFTLYLLRILSDKFVNISFDLFKVNIVRLIEYMSLITVPFAMILVSVSEQISNIIIKWPNLSQYLVLFLFGGMIKAIFELTQIVFITEGKENILRRIKIFEIILLVVFVVIFGGFFGIYGIGLSIVCATLIASIVQILIAHRYTKLDFIALSRDYFYIIFSGAMTILLLSLTKELFIVRKTTGVFYLIVLGIIIYSAFTLFLNHNLFKRFKHFVAQLMEE